MAYTAKNKTLGVPALGDALQGGAQPFAAGLPEAAAGPLLLRLLAGILLQESQAVTKLVQVEKTPTWALLFIVFELTTTNIVLSTEM